MAEALWSLETSRALPPPALPPPSPSLAWVFRCEVGVWRSGEGACRGQSLALCREPQPAQGQTPGSAEGRLALPQGGVFYIEKQLFVITSFVQFLFLCVYISVASQSVYLPFFFLLHVRKAVPLSCLSSPWLMATVSSSRDARFSFQCFPWPD